MAELEVDLDGPVGSAHWLSSKRPPDTQEVRATRRARWKAQREREAQAKAEAKAASLNYRERLAYLLGNEAIDLKEWDEDEHPRDERGRFSDKGLSYASLVDRIKTSGGFTVRILDGYQPPKGLAVSIHPERGIVMPMKDVRPTTLYDFVNANRDILREPNMYFGSWHDKSDDRLHLDLSTIAKHEDHAEAERLSRKHGQLAYWDLHAKKQYDVLTKEEYERARREERRAARADLAERHRPFRGRHFGVVHGVDRPTGDRGGNRRVAGSDDGGRRASLSHRDRRAGYDLADWDESQHPRDEQGKFTDGTGTESASGTGTAGGGGGEVSAPTAKAAGRPTPNRSVQDVASRYATAKGLKPVTHEYVEVDQKTAHGLADLYESLPDDDSANPAVQRAYQALASEVDAQWNYAIAQGMTFEPWTQDGQPYQNSTEMAEDVRTNKHMYFYTGGEPHPFLDARDETGLSKNDKFRAIHDYFGHAAGGYGFGPRGEENAWRAHSQMFGDEARRAMTTETRGQNSWVNFGAQNYNEDGSPKDIPPQDRPYAKQKVALLPDRFVFPERHGTLPDDPSRYFTAHPKAKLIPVSDLHVIRARDKGIDRAQTYMWLAKEGGEKRKPISVRRRAEGGYEVVDGNSTTAIARKHGWQALPAVDIEDEPAHLSYRDRVWIHLAEFDESQHPRDEKGQWTYVGGERMREPTKKDKARLSALKLPPAWKDVKISDDPTSDLQAVGVDEAGRTQYRYSAAHAEAAAAEKFARLKAFHRTLPTVRATIDAALAGDPASPDYEAALVLKVVDKTAFRIGSDKDTGASHHAIGASTLKAQHVKIDGETLTFRFTAKSGVRVNKTLHDKELAKLLKPRVQRGGDLFAVSASDVNRYLKRVAGDDFTVKDFRTWHGTATALQAVKARGVPKNATAFKKAMRDVAKTVSRVLGNTPSVALKSYIDPSVFSAWKVKFS